MTKKKRKEREIPRSPRDFGSMNPPWQNDVPDNLDRNRLLNQDENTIMPGHNAEW